MTMFVVSCEDNDPVFLEIASETVNNLHAPQQTDFTVNPPATAGNFTLFDIDSGEITTSTTDWDIAFRGTTILVNGGDAIGLNDEPARTGNASAYVENGSMATVTAANVNSLAQDGTSGLAIPNGSGNGWYTYAGPPTHLISPIAGKILVVKTTEGKYAKIEILSYYKDLDTTGDSRYYTFNYVYNPNDGQTSFE